MTDTTIYRTPVAKTRRFRGRRTWAAAITGSLLAVGRRCFEVAIDRDGTEVDRRECSRLCPLEIGDGLIAYSGDQFTALTVMRIIDGWGRCEVSGGTFAGPVFVMPCTGLRT